MVANNSLTITELDFDNIKDNLKTFLRSQSKFQDFDFEGSGMNVLLDLLAYNTHYMAYYLNMVGNEMFLDSSRIRQSTVSHAKMINYIPSSQKSSEAVVNIVVTPSVNEDQETNILTLNKYTRLIGADIDGVNYPFVTVNSNTVSKVNSSFTFANVVIKQGEVITRQYVVSPTNTTRRYEIPSSNVDIDSISIISQPSAFDTETTIYTKATNLLDIKANTPVYFVEENEKGNYTFYFGDNVIGKKPTDGSIITCTYIDCVGEAANKTNNFTIAVAIGNYNDNVIVSSLGASYSGSNKESIDDIKFRAPYFYTTQNRAVTIQDYELLILKDYNNIDSVSVWGGEENDPPVYGKVFLSLKTKENYFLSTLEKERIKETLISNRNILTVIPEIVDPDYTYLKVKGFVYYNPSATILSAEEVKTFARASILDYKADELTTFKSTFRKSKLQNYIETSEGSITGTDLKIFLQKRIEITPNETKRYTINTNFPIKKGDPVYKISSFPQIKVYDSSNILRQVYFEEIPEAFTGVDSISVQNPGINYTSVPTVTISGDGTGATAVATVSGNRITSIIVTNKGTNYTRATVTINGVGSEAVAVANLESRFGKLRSYYSKANGEKVIVDNNAGTIDYELGIIELTSLYTTGTVDNDFYGTDILTFNLPIDKEIISPLRNRIIDIDENDPTSIQIDVVSE